MTQTDDTALALRELIDTITTGESLPSLLQRVCESVLALMPDATAASVTLVQAGRPRTLTATDDAMLVVDQAQYDAGDGPCLEALRTATTVRADISQIRSRWPEFARAATAVRIATVLACPLPLPASDATTDREDMTRTSLGALNVLSPQPGAFDPLQAALVTMFTSAAAAAVLTARRWERAGALAEQLRTALATRDVIATAKGIIMVRRQVDPDGAFAWLAEVSQRTNRKIRDVAAIIVEEPALVETS